MDLQKRSTQDDSQTTKRFKLPDNFADEILNLELMMEETPIEYHAIQRLTDYYKMAIEYYTQLNNKRKDIFLKKLTMLHKKPDVKLAETRHQEQLEKQQKDSLQTDYSKVDSFKQTNFSLSLKNELHNANFQRSNIHNLVEKKQSQYEKVENLINDDINHQKELIQERIRQQKLKKQKQLEDKQIQNKFTASEKKTRALKLLKSYQALITSNMSSEKAKEIILKNQRISRMSINTQMDFQKYFEEHKNDHKDDISETSEEQNQEIKDQ